MAIWGIGLLLARSRGASLSSHIAIRRSVRGTLGNGVGPLGPSLVGVCAPMQYHIACVSGGATNFHGAKTKTGTAAMRSDETNWCMMDTQFHAQLRSSSPSLKARAPGLHVGCQGVSEGQRQPSPGSSILGGDRVSRLWGQQKMRYKMRGAIGVETYR